MSPPNDQRAPLEVPSWDAIFAVPARVPFHHALADWIGQQRWYRSKSLRIEGARVVATFAPPGRRCPACVAIVEVEGERPVSYVVPLAYLSGDDAEAFSRRRPRGVVVPLRVRADDAVEEGIVADALAVEPFLSDLLAMFGDEVVLTGGAHRLAFHRLPAPVWSAGDDVTPKVLEREQTNTSVTFGERFVCKVVRKLDDEPSADLEMGRFLTEVGFRHAPALAGYAEIGRVDPARAAAATVALLHEHVSNRGDAWAFARAALDRWLDDARANLRDLPDVDPRAGRSFAARPASDAVVDAFGASPGLFRRLGQRTGELHAALASRPSDPVFGPEPLDAPTRRALALDARARFSPIAARLREKDEPTWAKLERRRPELDARLDRISFLTDAGAKLRVHGDFHLGQVLFTGDDFVLIDFEGEPARSLAERRARRSPLVDVAGMLRSIDYAGWAALRERAERAEKDRTAVAPWIEAWCRIASAAFLGGWLGMADGAGILPSTKEARDVLLEFFLLEKCIYEIGYELDHRPEWLDIPVAGMLALLAEDTGRT